MKETVLRVAAFAVAVLAVVDPALTSTRSSRPVVSVVSGGRVDRLLRDDVTRVLSRRFTVLDGPSEGASATTVLGTTVPDDLAGVLSPAFAVLPTAGRQHVRINDVETPTAAPPNARIPVAVRLSVIGASGRQVDVDLSIDGARVSRVTAPVRSDSSIVILQSFVMPDEGTHRLGVSARVPGASADSVVTVIDVRRDRIPVLFFDARPSWTSTFVRRVLEQDARFAVSERMVTSRGLSNTSGAAPVGLRDYASLQPFATIVVGAPDQLSDGDLAGLEGYMRRRAGRVVLLMEGRSSPGIDRLSGVRGWRSAQLAAPAAINDSTGRRALRGRELLWPTASPTYAIIHADNLARDSTRRPILWSVPVGAGRLAISGAVDAWHYRDDAEGFDTFWPSFIASLALGAPEPIELNVSKSVFRPAEAGTLQIIARDALLSDQAVRESRMQAMLISGNDSSSLRAWPEQSPGVFTAAFVAPGASGVHRIAVSSGSTTAYVSIVVDEFAHTATDADPGVLRAFASSRKGTTVAEADVKRLPDLIGAAVQRVMRVETWYPMRTAWWMVPFALLLGAEWWFRRRRGLA